MYREVKLKDVVAGRLYWLKLKGKWMMTQYVLHDYPDGTSSYFFNLRDWTRIFDFDPIERLVAVDEPTDVDSVS